MDTKTAPKLPIHSTIQTGVDVLRNPKYNKGLAFSPEERRAFKLEGLMPGVVIPQDLQLTRLLNTINKMKRDIDKYEFLISLSDRNEALFYKLLYTYTSTFMPIVYTPTVGQACMEFGHIFRRPKGMYFSLRDKGRIYEMLQNWPEQNVRAIVFTDGERILGLGDLGTYGMGIPVGKLMLYTVCGGINPQWCLPVTLDVGTNNQELIKDPFYTGLKQPRARGKEFEDLVAEFMEAAARRFGRNTLLQFEDFGNTTAFGLLRKYADKYCTFNDDIQGTASVIVAGLYAAVSITKPLPEHKFVFYGAGEAGLGIASLIAYSIAQDSQGKITEEQARKNIFMVDSHGLVVKNRSSGNLNAEKLEFAHEHKEIKTLVDVVREIKPTALIGVCAIPQSFTEEIIREMGKNTERPIIFALSNPTSKAECTAEQAYKFTDGRAVFASGSPFAPVAINGKTLVPGQGNNSYIFPGVALGVLAVGSRHVPEKMFYVAAKSLARQVTKADLDQSCLYPPLDDIRKVSAVIAADVAEYAYEAGLATVYPKPKDLLQHVRDTMYDPSYPTYFS